MRLQKWYMVAAVVVAIGAAAPAALADNPYVKNLTPTNHQAPEGHPGVRGDGDDAVVVPEPGTLALLGVGLASLGVARRRRKSASR